MRPENTSAKSAWYSRPLADHPRAIRPLCFALLGSECWQAAALCAPSTGAGSSQDLWWKALALAGGVLLLAGLVDSFVFRHFRVAALALVVSLVSPPLWFMLLVGRAFGAKAILTPGLIPGPLFVFEYLEMHPALFWLCPHLPLALLALWVCHRPRRDKAGATALVLVVLVCCCAAMTARARREVAAAPHLTDAALAAVYAGHDTAAQKSWDHKRIVLTGAIHGEGDGLFGWGGPHLMEGSIDCDIVAGEWAVKEGQTVTLIGTCEGKDKYGNIEIAGCRVVQ